MKSFCWLNKVFDHIQNYVSLQCVNRTTTPLSFSFSSTDTQTLMPPKSTKTRSKTLPKSRSKSRSKTRSKSSDEFDRQCFLAWESVCAGVPLKSPCTTEDKTALAKALCMVSDQDMMARLASVLRVPQPGETYRGLALNDDAYHLWETEWNLCPGGHGAIYALPGAGMEAMFRVVVGPTKALADRGMSFAAYFPVPVGISGTPAVNHAFAERVLRQIHRAGAKAHLVRQVAVNFYFMGLLRRLPRWISQKPNNGALPRDGMPRICMACDIGTNGNSSGNSSNIISSSGGGGGGGGGFIPSAQALGPASAPPSAPVPASAVSTAATAATAGTGSSFAPTPSHAPAPPVIPTTLPGGQGSARRFKIATAPQIVQRAFSLSSDGSSGSSGGLGGSHHGGRRNQSAEVIVPPRDGSDENDTDEDEKHGDAGAGADADVDDRDNDIGSVDSDHVYVADIVDSDLRDGEGGDAYSGSVDSGTVSVASGSLDDREGVDIGSTEHDSVYSGSVYDDSVHSGSIDRDSVDSGSVYVAEDSVAEDRVAGANSETHTGNSSESSNHQEYVYVESKPEEVVIDKKAISGPGAVKRCLLDVFLTKFRDAVLAQELEYLTRLVEDGGLSATSFHTALNQVKSLVHTQPALSLLLVPTPIPITDSVDPVVTYVLACMVEDTNPQAALALRARVRLDLGRWQSTVLLDLTSPCALDTGPSAPPLFRTTSAKAFALFMSPSIEDHFDSPWMLTVSGMPRELLVESDLDALPAPVAAHMHALEWPPTPEGVTSAFLQVMVRDIVAFILSLKKDLEQAGSASASRILYSFLIQTKLLYDESTEDFTTFTKRRSVMQALVPDDMTVQG